MTTELKLSPALFADIQSHLLPPCGKTEEAAFLFATASREDDHVVFDVINSNKLSAPDFEIQSAYHIALTDEARQRVIKEAHALGASLVELHSHLGRWPAAFSPSDRAGLRETVPHMWWRLSKRPYIAVVVSRSGFDALVWLDDPHVPWTLGGIRVGRSILIPTNLSSGGWS